MSRLPINAVSDPIPLFEVVGKFIDPKPPISTSRMRHLVLVAFAEMKVGLLDARVKVADLRSPVDIFVESITNAIINVLNVASSIYTKASI
jgi:hypothetical protein